MRRQPGGCGVERVVAAWSASVTPTNVQIRHAYEVSQISRQERAALVEADTRDQIVGHSNSCSLTLEVDANFGCPRRRSFLDRQNDQRRQECGHLLAVALGARAAQKLERVDRGRCEATSRNLELDSCAPWIFAAQEINEEIGIRHHHRQVLRMRRTEASIAWGDSLPNVPSR